MPLPGKKKKTRRRLALFAVAILGSLLILPGLCHYYYYGDGASRALESIDFDGFDNTTGETFGGRHIVPNVIHYIRFNRTALTFVEYVCLRSAFLHQRPDRILVHTNVPGGMLNGTYWDKIRTKQPELYSRITVLPIDLPNEIYGQPLSEGWRLFHGSDIARIQTLIKYGGIYLDNDVYVVDSLDKYRKFELTIGWDENQFLGSQVILAHRDARFLPLWLETYRDNYRADLWYLNLKLLLLNRTSLWNYLLRYYNAGERPTQEILYSSPHLVHRVKLRFGVHMLMRELYDTTDWAFEKEQDTVHLLINHRSYLDPHYQAYPDFDADNIVHYPYTFGRMARLVMDWYRLWNCNCTISRHIGFFSLFFYIILTRHILAIVLLLYINVGRQHHVPSRFLFLRMKMRLENEQYIYIIYTQWHYWRDVSCCASPSGPLFGLSPRLCALLIQPIDFFLLSDENTFQDERDLLFTLSNSSCPLFGMTSICTLATFQVCKADKRFKRKEEEKKTRSSGEKSIGCGVRARYRRNTKSRMDDSLNHNEMCGASVCVTESAAVQKCLTFDLSKTLFFAVRCKDYKLACQIIGAFSIIIAVITLCYH